MRTPLKWVKEYVDINVSTEELCSRMIMHGMGVESVERVYQEYDGVVVGRLERIVPHQDSDHLQICTVNIGKDVPVTIVTGAPNVYEGMICPVAMPGTTLPGGKHIEAGELRGVRSEGMLCSGDELGIEEEELKGASIDGILPLNEALAQHLGEPFFGAAGLDSTVIDFEVFANRADCMSILGIAREIGAALDLPVTEPEIHVEEQGADVEQYVSVCVDAKDLCARYTARAMTDIKIEQSPLWMRRKLEACGVRPINNIVDITNYVMLELGYPLHAFDYDCVKDGGIIVRRALQGEKSVTLDGKEHTLDDNMLVIADKDGAIGLAGVMGGENSEITENTKMVLLEAAKFDGPNNRRTSRRLGVFSEAVQRFSKGIDAAGVRMAGDRAAQLMVQLGCAKVLKGMVDTDKSAEQTRTITIDPCRVNALLGTNISMQEMMVALNREHIGTVAEGTQIVCSIPHYRQDLAIFEDLAEEVARIYGYDKIPQQSMTGNQQGGLTQRQSDIEKLRMHLVGLGLHESMTMTLIGPSDFDAVGYAQDDPKRDCVRILNPLSEEYAFARSTVVPSMVRALAANIRNKVFDASMFELSNVHSKEADEQGLPMQEMVLTIGAIGEKFLWVKGVLENIFSLFRAPLPRFVCGGGEQYHPNRKALLMRNGEAVGEIGELHPDASDRLDIDRRICVAEIKISALLDHCDRMISYQPLPKYPAIVRDMAFIVKADAPVGDMMAEIKSAAGPLLESVELFDVYMGAQVEEGYKSVAFTLALRSDERTLVDEDANTLCACIVSAMEVSYEAKLRNA